MTKRMFVAIEPPERITAALVGHDPRLPGLRWLPASRMHLTLCFLAAVPEDNEQILIESLATIREPPLQLAVRGLGSFGRHGRPAVVWVGVEGARPLLSRLQRRVGDAVRAAGLDPGNPHFHPHITVGRCKGLSDRGLRMWLEKHAHGDFGAFEASGFTLFSSVLNPEGPEYQAVFRQLLENGQTG